MGNKHGNRKTGAERGESDIVRQKTLKSPINCSGIALHSGKKVNMTLSPAPVDSGIVFRRTDIAGSGSVIDASWKNVIDTRLCTSLGDENGVVVATVEHLMAALAGCGIDNAEIEISGPEAPVMDGSAAPFVFLVECAGIVEQDAPRRVIRVLKPVGVRDGEAAASLMPAEAFSLDFEIKFAGTAVDHQAITVGVEQGTFKKELSRARTFGFLHEVERLWAAGLARGGSLDNAVVVSGEKVLNEEGLRFDNEFVRHKVLDAIGDLYLAGAPIVGRFKGSCSGHATNNQLLRALFADRKAWTFDVMRRDDLVAPEELRQAV